MISNVTLNIPDISHFETTDGRIIGLNSIKDIKLSLNGSSNNRLIFLYEQEEVYPKILINDRSMKKVIDNIYSLLHVDMNRAILFPRNEDFVNANDICYYIIWRYEKATLTGIGKYFKSGKGYKSTSTILNGLRKVNNAMAGYNNKYKEQIEIVIKHYNLEFIPYSNQ